MKKYNDKDPQTEVYVVTHDRRELPIGISLTKKMQREALPNWYL